MYTLDPIYNNSIGGAFALRSRDGDINFKIQMLIGDIAILMEPQEIRVLLKVIKSANRSCTCSTCNCSHSYKTIKCNTAKAEVKFRLTKKELRILEELVLGILFKLDYQCLLSDNEIIK